MADVDEQWVADAVGGRVVSTKDIVGGRSRATRFVDVETPHGALRRLVLRRDTGDGPLSGSVLNLARETAVYAALSGRGLAVPELVATSPDGLAILVERAEGTDSFAGLSPAQQVDVLAGLATSVAELHAIPAAELDVPGADVGNSRAAQAIAEVKLWEEIYRTLVRYPEPSVNLALRYLRLHAPAGTGRPVLCHGDLGPGNFLHADGRVSALLDWEFAHVGDPMDDLAWLTVRTQQLTSLTDLSVVADAYTAASGEPVSPERLRYYQILVLTRMSIACLAAQSKPPGAMDAAVYYALLPVLRAQLVRLLGAQFGVDTMVESVAPIPVDTQAARILAAVTQDLGAVLMPELQTAPARARAMGMSILLFHLQTSASVGAELEAADRQDAAALLELEAVDLPREMSQLADALPQEQWPALLTYLARHAARQVALWTVTAAVATKPLPELTPRLVAEPVST